LRQRLYVVDRESIYSDTVHVQPIHPGCNPIHRGSPLNYHRQHSKPGQLMLAKVSSLCCGQAAEAFNYGQRSKVRIPPVASQVKHFLYPSSPRKTSSPWKTLLPLGDPPPLGRPSSPWETNLWLKGLESVLF